MAKKIDNSVLNELLRGCERPEELMSDGGLMKELRKALTQRMLGAELTEHLGYEHGAAAPPVRTNRRNGVSREMLKSEDGGECQDVCVSGRPVRFPSDRSQPWMGLKRSSNMMANWLTAVSHPLTVRAVFSWPRIAR
ncbi:MAG: transposase [Amaricoccus sp.]|uniref:transposase n=1 Tax=Amaricoccus sp. TaxID=1872485 RepID=UPI003315D5D5